MTRFDDSEVNTVAQNIARADPLTMEQLVHELDRLFNRMTFRYERTWQCRTQNWDLRLHAAMQTWRLLDDNLPFVKRKAKDNLRTYEELLREVYIYCDYMLSYLFQPSRGLSPLKELAGNSEKFLSQLPQKLHFDDLEAEANLKWVDEPRMRAIEHMNTLLAAFSLSRFDVFLSHSHRDKPSVRELKRHLVGVPLRVWLDEDELQPGKRWQDLLEEGIKNSSSVAVIIGRDGEGPWEQEEMRSALDLAVKDKRPVIPVLLPGAPAEPKLPMFLGNRTWVDLREGISAAGIGRLVWGITGEKDDSQ